MKEKRAGRQPDKKSDSQAAEANHACDNIDDKKYKDLVGRHLNGNSRSADSSSQAVRAKVFDPPTPKPEKEIIKEEIGEIITKEPEQIIQPDPEPAPNEVDATAETGIGQEDLEKAGYVEITDLQKSIDSLTKQLKRASSFRQSFVRGILTGFGVFIGSVLLTALLLSILSLLDTAPIVGEYIRKIINAIEPS